MEDKPMTLVLEQSRLSDSFLIVKMVNTMQYSVYDTLTKQQVKELMYHPHLTIEIQQIKI